MANDVKITSTAGISAAQGLSAGDSSYFADRVGIGTATPLGKLHVKEAAAGGFTFDGTADTFIVESNANGGITIATAAANTGRLIFASPNDATGAELKYSDATSLMTLGTTTPGDGLVFQSGNGVEAARIDSSGNVGIGTTSPIATLHVAGSAYVANDTTIMGNLSVHGDLIYIDTAVTVTSALSVINTGTGPALYVEQEGVEPIARFIDREGGEIHFADTGKVGIGTGSPTALLDISKSSQPNGNLGIFQTTNASGGWSQVQLRHNTSGYNDICGTWGADNNGVWFGGQSSANLRLYTNGGEKVTIDTSGNVGIGTSSPNEKLTVAGGISASEGLSAGKCSYFDGKVGIGTTSPSAGLHVKGDQNNIRIQQSRRRGLLQRA